jgi:hypothetical protein
MRLEPIPYDLRPELDGVFRSWAISRGLREISGIKRFPVVVDDHTRTVSTLKEPYEKRSTAKGQSESEIGEVASFPTDKMIALTFHGEHLKRSYRLIRTKEKNWLIFIARS